MGYFIILLFLILTIEFISKLFVKSNKAKKFLSGFQAVSSVIAVILLVTGICVGGLFTITDKYENKQIKSQETSVIETTTLIALKDSNLTDGSLFLGLGSINNSTYYLYYSKTEHGLKQNKLNADFDNVYIRYCSENDKPRIETENERTIYEYVLREKPNFWSLDLFSYGHYLKYEKGDVVEEKERDDIRHIIYVPEGSIKIDYTIDME